MRRPPGFPLGVVRLVLDADFGLLPSEVRDSPQVDDDALLSDFVALVRAF